MPERAGFLTVLRQTRGCQTRSLEAETHLVLEIKMPRTFIRGLTKLRASFYVPPDANPAEQSEHSGRCQSLQASFWRQPTKQLGRLGCTTSKALRSPWSDMLPSPARPPTDHVYPHRCGKPTGSQDARTSGQGRILPSARHGLDKPVTGPGRLTGWPSTNSPCAATEQSDALRPGPTHYGSKELYAQTPNS